MRGAARSRSSERTRCVAQATRSSDLKRGSAPRRRGRPAQLHANPLETGVFMRGDRCRSDGSARVCSVNCDIGPGRHTLGRGRGSGVKAGMKVMIRAMNREEIRNERNVPQTGSKPLTRGRRDARVPPRAASSVETPAENGEPPGRYDVRSIEFSNSISRETTSERPGLTTIYVSMHSSGSQASPLLSQQYPKGLPRDPHLSDRSTPVRTGSTRRAPAYLW